MEVLSKNWPRALGEVLASIIGSLGFVFLIAFVLSMQIPEMSSGTVFARYFSGGQLGLSILSVSGVTFIALLRHRATHQILAVVLLVVLVGPIAGTSFIVGLNPGFQPEMLSKNLLKLLWVLFIAIHFIWLVILLLEPNLPTAQEAGEAQEKRISMIKQGASRRG